MILLAASALIVHVLVDRDVLQVVVILFLARQRQLRALVQLVGVALTRYVHHDEVLLISIVTMVVLHAAHRVMLG